MMSFPLGIPQVYKTADRLTQNEPIGFHINHLAKTNTPRWRLGTNGHRHRVTHTDAFNTGTDIVAGINVGM